ncbi:MAG: amidotransferase, partial [Desulfohalobiaceae bacterium]
NQAFVLDGGRVVGMQFHLEMGRADLSRLVNNCSEDLTPGPFVQPAATMLASNGFKTLRPLLFDFLDRMAPVIAA